MKRSEAQLYTSYWKNTCGFQSTSIRKFHVKLTIRPTRCSILHYRKTHFSIFVLWLQRNHVRRVPLFKNRIVLSIPCSRKHLHYFDKLWQWVWRCSENHSRSTCFNFLACSQVIYKQDGFLLKLLTSNWFQHDWQKRAEANDVTRHAEECDTPNYFNFSVFEKDLDLRTIFLWIYTNSLLSFHTVHKCQC